MARNARPERPGRRQGKAPRGGRSGWKWWQGMLGGMLLMVSPGAALLLVTLAGPSILAFTIDTTPNRALTRTVILFSLAGAIEPLRAFLTAGHDLAAAFSVLGHPAAVLLAWLSGGCGWLLDEIFGLAAALATNLRHAARRAALETKLSQIQDEWGLPDHR